MVVSAKKSNQSLSDMLVVRLAPNSNASTLTLEQETLSFVRIQRARVVQRGRALLAELPRARDTVLLFAAEDVLVLERSVPPLSERRLRAALPALVEDATFVDLTSLHVAASADHNGKRLLAVIDRKLLSAWLERFEADDRLVTRVWCEQLAMPHGLGTATLAVRGEQGAAGAVLRIGSDNILTLVGAASDEVIVAHAVARQPNLSEAVVYGERDATALFEAMFTRLGLACRRGGTDALVEFIEGDNRGETIDLLQGEFVRGFTVSSVRAWSASAALVLLALVIETAGLSIHSGQLEHDKSQLVADQSAVLKRTFPETTTVLDAPAQMRRALDTLKGHMGQGNSADFEALLSHAGALLSSLPTNVCTEMHFDDDTLSMNLKAPTLANAQVQSNLQKAAHAVGNTATFVSTGSDGDLTLRLAPGKES